MKRARRGLPAPPREPPVTRHVHDGEFAITFEDRRSVGAPMLRIRIGFAEHASQFDNDLDAVGIAVGAEEDAERRSGDIRANAAL